MDRCARGTCGRFAVTGLVYDPIGRSMWLVDLPAERHELLALCGAHADNLVVPQGWTSSDHRTGSPRLWNVAPASEAAEGESEARSVRRPTHLDQARARRQTTVEPLALFDPDELCDSPSANPRSVLIPGTPAPSEAVEALDHESTPLLARAFRGNRAG